MSTVPPPARAAQEGCSDCSAVADGDEIVHDPTCRIGLDLDDTAESDARWFADHPGAQQYFRPPSWSEIQLGCECGDPRPVVLIAGRVRVIQVADGVRGRDLSGLRFQHQDVVAS